MRRLAPPTAVAAAPAAPERGLPVQDDAWITTRGASNGGAEIEEEGERAAQNEELSADVIARDGDGAFPGYFLGGGSDGNGKGNGLGMRSISLLQQRNERASQESEHVDRCSCSEEKRTRKLIASIFRESNKVRPTLSSW